MRTAQFFLMLLLAAASSNALAEVRDAHTPTWTDFKFQTQNLFNVQSPVTPVQIGNDLAVLEEQHLFAQTQAAEQNDSNQSTEKDSALSGANEAARQSSNPLGGDFFILLNQIDNFAMQGDITDKTRWINNWAFQPVVPVPMDKTIGKHWIWVNRPTFNFVLNADLPDVIDKIRP
jgi:thiamine biosynthesis lipoprotein ApbE